MKKAKATYKKKTSDNTFNDFRESMLKKYGEDVVLNFRKKRPDLQIIPTRSRTFNWLLSCGGVPRGRVIEVSGPESSGKTTSCFHMMAVVLDEGGRVMYIDQENSIDLPYMQQCGIDPDNPNIIFAQPDYGEQALALVEDAIDNVDIIVFDSIAAMVPQAELTAKISDQQMALQARLLAKSMRRLGTMLKGSKTCAVFTNQVRDKIGGFSGYGPTYDTPGGRALKHAASIRIWVRRGAPLKAGAEQIGFLCRMTAKKNKVGMPGRVVDIPIIFGVGIDTDLDFINLALKSGAIRKNGPTYKTGRKLGAGIRTLGTSWRSVNEKLGKLPKLKTKVETHIEKFLLAYESGKLIVGKDE